jgi:hypothetical protein
MHDQHDDADRQPRWTRWLRWGVGVTAAGLGAAVALVVTAVGHCSAFGGRCPADPVPLLEDDVFGMVALAIGTATAIVGVCLRPSWRGAITGLVAAVPIGLLAGLLAATSARG